MKVNRGGGVRQYYVRISCHPFGTTKERRLIHETNYVQVQHSSSHSWHIKDFSIGRYHQLRHIVKKNENINVSLTSRYVTMIINVTQGKSEQN